MLAFIPWSWEWILSKLTEIVGRHFLDEYGPLVSEPHPDEWNAKQNMRNFRRFVLHREAVAETVAKLAAAGYVLPDAPSRFSLTFVNHQRTILGADTIEKWTDEAVWLDLIAGGVIIGPNGVEMQIDLQRAYDACMNSGSPLDLPVWWLPMAFKLLYVPNNELGLVLWQMRRLRALSQQIDAYKPGEFRRLTRP